MTSKHGKSMKYWRLHKQQHSYRHTGVVITMFHMSTPEDMNIRTQFGQTNAATHQTTKIATGVQWISLTTMSVSMATDSEATREQ
jgi:hypothetical protein